MVGGKRLVRQVVQFKKTYSRNVCHIKFYVLGDRKEIVICFGGNRKEIRCLGDKKEVRVNEESH